MFGIGPTEIIIIGIVAVLLFGSRLPKVAFSLGNSLTQFKRGLHESMEEIHEYENLIENGTNHEGGTYGKK